MKHRHAIKEIRDNRIKYESDNIHLAVYNQSLFEKITALRNSVFKELNPGVTYLLDNIIINDSTVPIMNCIRALYGQVYSIFNFANTIETAEINVRDTNTTVEKKHKGPRIPNRGSFFLYNQNVNFNAIHARLIPEGHHFIDPSITSADDIRAVFGGQNVTEKVVWLNANSLRYFIRELNKRKLIEPTTEGIWRRTIACFKPEEGEFEQNDFKDTKDPIAGVTLILDEVLRLFSA
jgi:hypothetical protein